MTMSLYQLLKQHLYDIPRGSGRALWDGFPPPGGGGAGDKDHLRPLQQSTEELRQQLLRMAQATERALQLPAEEATPFLTDSLGSAGAWRLGFQLAEQLRQGGDEARLVQIVAVIRHLLRNSSHLELLKTCIILIERLGKPEEDLDLLQVLAFHPELSLPATRALLRVGSERAMEALKNLVAAASGWPRVDATRALVEWGDEQLGPFLVRHGVAGAGRFEGQLAYEILRFLGPVAYLSSEEMREGEQLIGASDLLRTVADEGMNGGVFALDRLEDVPAILSAYMAAVELHPPSPAVVHAVLHVLAYRMDRSTRRGTSAAEEEQLGRFLAYIRSDEVVNLLREGVAGRRMLPDGRQGPIDPAERARCARLAATLGLKQVLPDLKVWLTHEPTAAAAIEALARLGDAEDRTLLLDHAAVLADRLDHADLEETRRELPVTGLPGDEPGGDEEEGEDEDATARIVLEPDESLAAYAEAYATCLALLGTLATDEATDRLVAACQHRDPRIRRAALTGIRELPPLVFGVAEGEAVLNAIGDEKGSVVAEATSAIVRFRPRSAVPVLLQYLEREMGPEELTGLQGVLEALATLADPKAIPPIERFIADQPPGSPAVRAATEVHHHIVDVHGKPTDVGAAEEEGFGEES